MWNAANVELKGSSHDAETWTGQFRDETGSHFDAVTPGSPMICVTVTEVTSEVGYHRKHTGLSHLAVRVDSRAAVTAFVDDFLTPRGIEPLYGGAKEYNYSEGYFAAYCEDADRIKIEVMTSDEDQAIVPRPALPGDAPLAHETASVYVVRYTPGEGWRVLLILHERLGGLTIPGGHVKVEQGETAAQAGVRETLEEAGVDIVLLSPPVPAPPAGFPHRVLPAPWWPVSGPASPDGGAAVHHVHNDQQFIALPVGDLHPGAESEPVWLTADELEVREDCLEDTRVMALMILRALDRVGEPGRPAALARGLLQAMDDAVGAAQ